MIKFLGHVYDYAHNNIVFSNLGLLQNEYKGKINVTNSAIFLNKIHSRTHRVAQNSVGNGKALVISMSGKRFQNAILACILLRKNIWNGNTPGNKHL
jgi:hypothetical protein